MEKLFSEFKPSSLAEWKTQLLKDLKGETYESLIWHNENGIDIKPYFTGEDLRQVYEPAFTHTDWDITVHPGTADSKALNKVLLAKLNSGASAISVMLANHKPEELLRDIQLNYIRSTFYVNSKNAQALKNYLAAHYEPSGIHAALFPESFQNESDLTQWSELAKLFADFSNIHLVSFNGLPYHNLNCFAYYEIAILMAGLVEQMEHFSTSGNLTHTAFALKTGVSSDYFMQMAKLRAIRRLWKLISAQYQIQKDLHLVVETSLTNKSISDHYNNLLRSTVEAMAAVSGGCNELLVSEYDVFVPQNTQLSTRMAVNQQLILKKESYLDQMADVACGSFYVENITDALAAKALAAFKEIEKEGGFMQSLKSGRITDTILQQAKQREEWFKSGKQVVIGVNKFRNEKEQLSVPLARVAELKALGIHNPVLNYELENFFKVTHA